MTETSVSSSAGKRFDRHHWVAVATAFFVTILWSSSFVIIKFGLLEIPPLIFAGLRYTVAAIILVTAALAFPSPRLEIKNLSRRWWYRLVLYGVVYYTITMSTQFIGLLLLPATTVSFILNFTTILVVMLAFVFLQERPNWKQMVLVLVALMGAFLFFWPIDFLTSSLLGILVMVISLIANAFSSIIGREINQSKQVSALVVTAISMMIGAILLLVAGFLTTPVFVLSPNGIIIIVWLAVINTALAFTLWNQTMQQLTALESTIINSTMLVQIALLSLVFLGEVLIVVDWIGIILVMTAAMLIPVLRTKTSNKPEVSKQTE